MGKIETDSLSRIDKLFLDKGDIPLEEAIRRRTQHGIYMLAGTDLKESVGLQLALLTAVNLASKCFAQPAIVNANAEIFSYPCLVPAALSKTLGEALTKFGGTTTSLTPHSAMTVPLIFGSAEAVTKGIRVTYDGWRIAVGPVVELRRMQERDFCPLACIAAAAIAVGEIFADFAGINLKATRRTIHLSLWRSDLPFSDPASQGPSGYELPLSIGVFGLGHLGQAYLWGISALRYSDNSKVMLTLCDDDTVEKPNVETGALLTEDAIGQQKTRVVAQWLEARGFKTKLLERWVDENLRRTSEEPGIALSGFDDNQARQWLSQAGFSRIFDSGLGGEAYNFDTIGYHAWPNPRSATELWPLETEADLAARKARRTQSIAQNKSYSQLDTDECGRIQLAGKSVAVPFVGAIAACTVLAEMIKSISGGPVFSDLRISCCSLSTAPLEARLACEALAPIRGIDTVSFEGDRP